MSAQAKTPMNPGPNTPARVEIFDTTLRDGSQLEGITLTVDDKLRIARHLDNLGIAYIEGGWPGANPKDDEFFERAPFELDLQSARLVTFGATRRAGGSADGDPVLANVIKGGTDAVCIVGKTWDYHVTEALRTTLDEAAAMVGDSVKFLKDHNKEVLFDAEHFFDGYKANPEFALQVLHAAEEAGVDCLVLCDTNGGTMPFEVEQIVAEVRAATGTKLGAHFHNDSECAVANSLVAVRQGAEQVQGCVNGLGERTGNTNLTSLIANLELKLGVHAVGPEHLQRLSEVSHAVAEIANVTLSQQAPYVGQSAFAHKAGLHVSALARRPDAYEHIDPMAVGNDSHLVVSELAGRATVVMKAAEAGIDVEDNPETVGEILEKVKSLEHVGYHFEAADGSFELLVRSATGWEQHYFELESFRVIMEKLADGETATEATIKLSVDGERHIATAEGNGPVNALDKALRSCIGQRYPELESIHLDDYKVRVLDTNKGTGAVTRVLIDTTDGRQSWGTIGVSDNIIEASWQALSDSIVVGLLHARDESG